nr:MAG TPA: hypothetical protein [Caudoviricetes sp.]
MVFVIISRPISLNSIAQFCYRRGSLSSTSYGFP